MNIKLMISNDNIIISIYVYSVSTIYVYCYDMIFDFVLKCHVKSDWQSAFLFFFVLYLCHNSELTLIEFKWIIYLCFFLLISRKVSQYSFTFKDLSHRSGKQLEKFITIQNYKEVKINCVTEDERPKDIFQE